MRELMPNLLHYYAASQRMAQKQALNYFLFAAIFFTLISVSVFSGPLIAAWWFHIPRWSSGLSIYYRQPALVLVAGLLSALLTTILCRVEAKIIEGINFTPLTTVSWMGSAALVLGLLALEIARRGYPWATFIYLLICMLLGSASFFAFFVLLTILANLLRLKDKCLQRSQFPEAAIVAELADVLILVSNYPAGWSSVKFRHNLMSSLEDIASDIERNLPFNVRQGPAESQWQAGQVRQIAAYFRWLNEWLLTPRSDTRGLFIDQISDALCNIVRGTWDWGQLTQAEFEASRQKTTWRNISKDWVITLSLAFLPLLLFLIFKRLLGIVDPLLSYVKIGTYLWAILTLALRIDPTFSSKVAAFKDLSQIFRNPVSKD